LNNQQLFGQKSYNGGPILEGLRHTHSFSRRSYVPADDFSAQSASSGSCVQESIVVNLRSVSVSPPSNSQEGKPQNGFLRLYDIYNLNLSAELVVLSACQTALGKDIKGEGLVGLTRAFMYAGASRIVASLWRTEDRANAVLMNRFYESMLAGNGMSPAAAIRKAQLSVWQDKRWRQPRYWAAFTLQGEWK
jgi:CHAT domain-containing protein